MIIYFEKYYLILCLVLMGMATGCQDTRHETSIVIGKNSRHLPLVTDIFTADPSAHVFDNQIFIYTSHDLDTDVANDHSGSHYDMKDYYVLKIEDPEDGVVQKSEILNLQSVPWAERQMWAPDVAEKDGKYYLYFPARDSSGIFRIGVSVSDDPMGPFVPMKTPLRDAYSIDPVIFKDTNGSHYMCFGGLRGGQLQNWQNGYFDSEAKPPVAERVALMPKIAKLRDDMVSLEEKPRDIQILDENGNSLMAGDEDRRFFEGAWMHYYDGKYYLSYSTGTTHKIVYATGDSPYGPFTYQGVIVPPVIGWTNHHSIIQFDEKWYVFYHDSSLSGGVSKLRSVKMAELNYDAEGNIKTIAPYID